MNGKKKWLFVSPEYEALMQFEEGIGPALIKSVYFVPQDGHCQIK